MERTALTADIAIVVPVLDDAEALAALLDRLGSFATQAREIVVVAGRNDEHVAGVCARYGCRLIQALANRGERLDRGARATRARIVWFLHADAAPPADALESIEQAVAAGAESGCFRFTFQGAQGWHKRLLAALVNCRTRLGGMAYGDQGLFATREAYLACGGFVPAPLFEEVPLVKALRRRRTFRRLSRPLAVSTRRWERDGWWLRTCHNRWLALCYMLGVPPERLAVAYRERRIRGTTGNRG